jgi:glutamate/tyrosine decarboxylase-like PLP-dependent enzyme
MGSAGSERVDAAAPALELAHAAATAWLDSLDDRSVPARATVEEVAAALGPDLPDGPTDAAEVIELLVRASEPGLVAMPSGRFYGMVIGGTHPAGLAADWLVSAWDQNSALRQVTPAHSAVEDVAAAWLLDLLGLPAGCAVGYASGATMSNFTCLAAGRDATLRRAGWDVAAKGLAGGPPVRVLVGAQRHATVDLALRYLGLGLPEVVPADRQSRIDVAALTAALAERRGEPTVVVLQAGDIHSGAFDDFVPAIAAAHEAGAWVHVDGAFGLWAAAAASTRHLMAGAADADSWTTDAHKTLNVPYDCGIAIVRDLGDVRAAMGVHGEYLIHDAQGDPSDKVPELSRRGRAFTVWAVLRALGRSGVDDLVDRLCRHARAFAAGLSEMDGVEVLNDVVFTQVCAAFGSDRRTRRVIQLLLADGTAWISGSTWHGRAVLRISVSNWSTTDDDVATTLAALRRAAAAADEEEAT